MNSRIFVVFALVCAIPLTTACSLSSESSSEEEESNEQNAPVVVVETAPVKPQDAVQDLKDVVKKVENTQPPKDQVRTH